VVARGDEGAAAAPGGGLASAPGGEVRDRGRGVLEELASVATIEEVGAAAPPPRPPVEDGWGVWGR
jgi:hypothetical protein